MTTKEIYNDNKTKLVMINRSLLADGYNYYTTLLVLNLQHNIYFIDDNHKQKEEIKSYKAALNYANNILNN
jgi:hypothetical protein